MVYGRKLFGGGQVPGVLQHPHGSLDHSSAPEAHLSSVICIMACVGSSSFFHYCMSQPQPFYLASPETSIITPSNTLDLSSRKFKFGDSSISKQRRSNRTPPNYQGGTCREWAEAGTKVSPGPRLRFPPSTCRRTPPCSVPGPAKKRSAAAGHSSRAAA